MITPVRPGVLRDADGVLYFSAATLWRAVHKLAHDPGPAPDHACDVVTAVIGAIKASVDEANR